MHVKKVKILIIKSESESNLTCRLPGVEENTTSVPELAISVVARVLLQVLRGLKEVVTNSMIES